MISPVFSRVAIAVVCTMGRPAINPVAASAATEAAVEIDVIAPTVEELTTCAKVDLITIIGPRLTMDSAPKVVVPIDIPAKAPASDPPVATSVVPMAVDVADTNAAPDK